MKADKGMFCPKCHWIYSASKYCCDCGVKLELVERVNDTQIE